MPFSLGETAPASSLLFTPLPKMLEHQGISANRPGVLTLQGQVLVDEGDGHAAFAYTARDTLDRLMPHVARAEKPGEVRFQQERWPPLLPELEVAPGTNVAVFVPLQAIRQPVRVGVGSDHHEQRIRLPRPWCGAAGAGANRLQMVFAAG